MIINIEEVKKSDMIVYRKLHVHGGARAKDSIRIEHLQHAVLLRNKLNEYIELETARIKETLK